VEAHRVGRFGWKANTPDLTLQVAGAYAGDMGVSSPLHPEADGSFELSQAVVDDATFYVQTLAVPNPVPDDFAGAKRGEALFERFGCESCHLSELETGAHPVAHLSGQRIAAYTDLLLHDMGEGLADHRPDWSASGAEWRTAPLWGIGLTQTVLPGAGYLHDGRARTLEEAILWHGGEAEDARERFRLAPAADRRDLIAFLRAL
ncbi:MAG TPA: di-heme oxidoredictase family protein, partial [Myxococcota bacterium]|nr:di-heme oxidoredictase family protein [Myxococcota bacterium]